MAESRALGDWFKTLPQYLIPQHFLSKIVFKLSRWQLGFLTRWIIKRFIQYYKVDMTLAQSPEVCAYANFNQFFTRALKPTARPLAKASLICPVDGEISQLGRIEQQQLYQAKGRFFQLSALLGGDTGMVTAFQNGLFCTIYLSPKDYHRIHMPVTGQLKQMIYLPGRLFSVNQRTTRVVDNLFARNERVICLFTTEFGPVALILVGAIFVGSIETVWAGVLTPPYLSYPQHWRYAPETTAILSQGVEMGRFNMGSTVILLIGNEKMRWSPALIAKNNVHMGQALT